MFLLVSDSAVLYLLNVLCGAHQLLTWVKVKGVLNIEWSCNILCISYCLHFAEHILSIKMCKIQSYVELHGTGGMLIFSCAAAWALPTCSIR